MRSNVVALVSGSIFAIGLALSGMTKPSKVIGFLDVAGAWDASLAFVMMGAIAVHFVAQRIAKRRTAPLFDTKFHLPLSTQIDRRLVLGAMLFGVGWGLGGFCPGPALVTLGSGQLSAVVFVAGMLLGIFAQHSSLRAVKAP